MVDAMISIRDVLLTDANDIYALVRNNIRHLSLWLPWADDHYNLQNCVDHIKNSPLECAIMFDGNIVGLIGAYSKNEYHQKAAIGFWLDERMQGRGIMPKVIRQFISLRLEDVVRVEATVDFDNKRSIACLEKSGFSREGLMKSYERTPYGFKDHYLYAYISNHSVVTRA